jgi:hypothetical protein
VVRDAPGAEERWRRSRTRRGGRSAQYTVPQPRDMEFTYPLAVGTLVSLYCVSRHCGVLDGPPSSPHPTCVPSNPMMSPRLEARRATTPRETVWCCTVATYRCKPMRHGRAPGQRHRRGP